MLPSSRFAHDPIPKYLRRREEIVDFLAGTDYERAQESNRHEQHHAKAPQRVRCFKINRVTVVFDDAVAVGSHVMGAE